MRRILAGLVLAGFLCLPISAAEEEKYVALTFDDGPSGKYTEKLLDGLYGRGVKATFLLCGYRIAQYPELTQRIFDEGHEIGYHGYSHNSMETMSRRSIAEELIKTRDLLPEDCDPVLFRPPGGIITDGVRQVAQARLLTLLSWSVDPRDWEGASSSAIEAAVLETVKDGDIILLHDMSFRSVRAALDIVDALEARGYRFLTVSELARRRKIRLKPGEICKSLPPQGKNSDSTGKKEN